MITTRHIDIVSDNGQYRLRADMVAVIDGYRLEIGAQYRGSYWKGGFLDKGGMPLPYIESADGACISFSEYGGGLCQHGVPFNKNTLLFGAFLTGYFTKALEGIDFNKIRKDWYKAYVEGRIKDGTL